MFCVCLGERTLPVLVSSYFAGWIYWPVEALRALHHDNVLRLRFVGIGLGALELLFTWILLQRLRDELTAAAGTLVTAVSSPYVYVHAVLVHYEFVPWMFLSSAILVWWPKGRPLAPARFVLGAGLVGLALAGNIKAIFLLVPLGAYAAFSGVALPAPLRRFVPHAAAAALLPLAPLATFAVSLDPASGFSHQVSDRFSVLAKNLFSLAWIYEPLNLFQYWSDVASYGDVVQGFRVGERIIWIVPALSLAYAVKHVVFAVRKQAHDRVAAASGFLILGYFPVAALLYSQQPAANYAPLHTVFGVATGAFAVSAGRAIAKACKMPLRAPAFGMVIAAAAAAALGFNVVKRGNPRDTVSLSFNLTAQEALVARLVKEGATVVTTTYNLAGVIDSLSRGRVRTTAIHPWFSRCTGEKNEALLVCLTDRWDELLHMPALQAPLSVVVPVRGSMVDERYVSDLVPALERAAQNAGRQIETREDFETGRGVPVLSRLVVR